MEMITFEVPTPAVWLVALTLGSIGVALILPRVSRQDDLGWMHQIGLDRVPAGLRLLGITLWLILFVIFFLGLGFTIVQIPHQLSAADATYRFSLLTIAAMTAGLSALVALPFTLIRMRQAERQTKATEQKLEHDALVLFNEKVANATADLSAVLTNDAAKQTSQDQEPIPDLVRRVSAIHRLVALAFEQPRQAAQLAHLMHVYILVNFPKHCETQNPTKSSIYTRAHNDAMKQLIPAGSNSNVIEEKQELHGSIQLSVECARSLRVRSDNQIAFEAFCHMRSSVPIETRRKIPNIFEDLSLCGLNLGDLDISGLTFERCRFANVHFFGTRLRSTKFRSCQFLASTFDRSEMDSATSFARSDLIAVAFRRLRIAAATSPSKRQLNECFGDASVTFSVQCSPPDSWAKNDLGAGFKSAYEKWLRDLA